MNQGRVWCFTARVLTALNCAMVDHGMIIDRGMKCHFFAFKIILVALFCGFFESF